MKKVVLILFIVFIFMFVLSPFSTYALSLDHFCEIVDAESGVDGVDNWMDSGDSEDLECVGDDSILGNPDDESSVAWLLNQALTYSTIAGIVIVVVLSSIDFMTVIVKSDDESMNKVVKKLGMRIVLAILLFFVPTFTNALLDLFGLTSQSSCGIKQ